MKYLVLIFAIVFGAIASSNGANFEGVEIPRFPTIMEIMAKMKVREDPTNPEDPILDVDFSEWWDGFFEVYRRVMENNGLDHLNFPANVTSSFEREFLGTVYEGKMTMSDRFVAGVHTLHRIGDARLTIVPIQSDDDEDELYSTRFTGELGVDFVSIGSKLIVEWMNLTGYPDVEATVKDIKIHFAGRLQSDCKAELENHEVVLGAININIDGLEGPLADLIGVISGIVEKILMGGVNDIFETGMRWIWEDLIELAKESSLNCQDENCPSEKKLWPMPNLSGFKKPWTQK